MKYIYDDSFEASLSDDWAGDLDVREVPLSDRPLFYLGLLSVLLGLVVVTRILFLGTAEGKIYRERADGNLGFYERIPALRGHILDRHGVVIADNEPVFSAYLNVRDFLRYPEAQKFLTDTLESVLHIPSEELWEKVRQYDLTRTADLLVLNNNLEQGQVVALTNVNLPALVVKEGFRRAYPQGSFFSHLVGYIGFPTKEDLEKNSDLLGQDLIGKTGLELQYDDLLRGKPGVHVAVRDAKGKILNEYEESIPQPGADLKLTVDAEFQKYFQERLAVGLTNIGKTSGGGIALNPKTGEVLALVSMPTFDNNLFATTGKNLERLALLTDPHRPLFNRIISGAYNPGSTIKPLHGLAALSEKVIGPSRTIFSPGYLDVPNPYNPEEPTRFVDWRYQGDVNVYSAIAQSSNVYFYVVGGGFGDIKGLGLTRLRDWWQKFHFGDVTGIDAPGEAAGFLPSADWKKKTTGRDWLLGDTYNVSIGQGDLSITPVQLISYISALANGGFVYRPYINSDSGRYILSDLRKYQEEILEIQKGMRATVTASLGTAHALDDLPVEAAAKTGTAQVRNKTQENAFFAGYAPYEDPEIALLVFIEDAKVGGLNAVPVAKDVLNWYYEHRLKNTSL